MRFPVQSLLLTGGAAALALAASAHGQVGLTPIGSFGAGFFDESAAEIAAFDPGTNQLFVVNGATSQIDVLDISDPTLPTLAGNIALPANAAFGGIQSVAVSNGVVAVAIANDTVTDNGFVGLFDLGTLNPTNTLTVGALPDSLAFTPDGQTIVVANEGEASDDGLINPNGSISIIDLSGGAAAASSTDVTTLDFNPFEGAVGPGNVPILSSDNSPITSVRINPVSEAATGAASDIEPEFVTISSDGQAAFVSLQENNAIAVVDLASQTIAELLPLGVVDFSQPGNGIDGRDNDQTAVIENPSVFGLFLPDGITTFEADGETFIVTANEGDGRDDEDFGGLFLDFADLDDIVDTDVDAIQDGAGNNVVVDVDAGFLAANPGIGDNDNPGGIGDLEISLIDGDVDNDGELEQLFAFGTRSFSIFDTNGDLVFNSGDDFEQTIAQLIVDGDLPATAFNTDNDSNSAGENRSDDSGPEPEGVVIGQIGDQTLAFIGIERVGGFFIYDVTDPENVEFVEYVNPRDFSQFVADDLDDDTLIDAADLELALAVEGLVGTLTGDLGALDLGPEGLVFIGAADSPTGIPLLVVTNEVSGTTTIFTIPEPGTGVALLALAGLGMLRRRRGAP